jgi:hypothetical protein
LTNKIIACKGVNHVLEQKTTRILQHSDPNISSEHALFATSLHTKNALTSLLHTKIKKIEKINKWREGHAFLTKWSRS